MQTSLLSFCSDSFASELRYSLDSPLSSKIIDVFNSRVLLPVDCVTGFSSVLGSLVRFELAGDCVIEFDLTRMDTKQIKAITVMTSPLVNSKRLFSRVVRFFQQLFRTFSAPTLLSRVGGNYENKQQRHDNWQYKWLGYLSKNYIAVCIPLLEEDFPPHGCHPRPNFDAFPNDFHWHQSWRQLEPFF